MTTVIEFPRHLSDAAKACDNFSVDFHNGDVRRERTKVNAENVPGCEYYESMKTDTVGQRLLALKQRSGLTLDQIAKGMGLKGRSSVQRLFNPHLETLELKDAVALAVALEGHGIPPISGSEVTALSVLSEMMLEVTPNSNQLPAPMTLPRDVPVYHTALGTFAEERDGTAIEQAYIDPREVMDFFPRPPGYSNRRGIYGIYVAGPSMEPRWEPGDPAYVDPKRPPNIGDDVIVYMVRPTEDAEELDAVLIKRLVRRSGSFLELEQFNPPSIFRVDNKRIKAVHRVIPRRELLTFA